MTVGSCSFHNLIAQGPYFSRPNFVC